MKQETLATILSARAEGRVPVWITSVEEFVSAGNDTPTEDVLFPLDVLVPPDSSGTSAPGTVGTEPSMAAAQVAVREDRAVEFKDGGVRYMARPFNPPARLIVVGAVHVAQALVPMAAQAGLGVIVVDPRPMWLSEFRFPDVQLLRAWPEEAFAELGPDHRTAIVTLTHDPKVDDPALLAALGSPAFYVGALGSRRTHKKRVERLAAAGADLSALERIHSPVGLDIGARSPAEIAVSVLAQVIQVLRTPPS
jgi:xanthine dehydrogenase accessory factor